MSTPAPSPLVAHRTRALVLAAVVLVLDLATKQWALTHLANGVHPIAVRAGEGPVGAALTARGLSAAAQDEARSSGARVIVSHAFESEIGRRAAEEIARRIAPREIHGLAPFAGIDALLTDREAQIRRQL